jgi:hypothetical protein
VQSGILGRLARRIAFRDNLFVDRGVVADVRERGSGESSVLFWQEAPDVEAELSITHGGASEIEQVANSLTLASPADTRIEGGA